MLTKKTMILSFLVFFVFIFAFSFLTLGAEKFKSAEEFSQYIYDNYSQEKFSIVYDNFAAELKRELELREYTNFQRKTFEKYNLEYSNIKIAGAEKIDFKKIKDKFDYASDFGKYYQLEVSYLIKFDRFGRREKNSDKKIYLRKIKDDFQIFWDYKEVIDIAENKDGED